MANMTLTAVATAALQKLHAISSGEPLTAQMLTDCLDRMNARIDNWSLEQAMCPPLLVTPALALVAGTRKYTIGAGQTFNITRPVDIIAAVHSNTTYGTTLETPIKVLTAAQWAQIPDRTSSDLFIKYLFYDRATAVLGNVYVSPVPIGGTLELTTWQPLTQFVDATTPIVTQFPGYYELYQHALGMIMAPELGLKPDDQFIQDYLDSIARVRNLNSGLLNNEPPAGQTSAAAQPSPPIMESRS